MVAADTLRVRLDAGLSVLALSSRFDGRNSQPGNAWVVRAFQYSLCRVVLMVGSASTWIESKITSFSTRSVESF